MTKESYDQLSDRDKIMVDLLIDIAGNLRKLTESIARDLERALS